MFDILVSFGLGILLGVCLTLLTLSIKNKRKASVLADIIEPAEANTISASTTDGQDFERDAIRQRTQENLERSAVKSEFDELEGFVRLDGVSTELPEPETSLPEAEIVDKIPSDEHLENEWIEAERVEATRVELELQETARLETMHQASDHFEEDHPVAEEINNLNLQEEFAALQALQALQLEVARAEAERIAEDRNEAERIEAIRLEAERVEAERVEAERLEVERVETERVEAEQIEAEQIEAKRVEAERVDAERIETERVAAEHIEAERVEAERIEAERLAAERIKAERIEAERVAAEHIEAERAAAEQIEAELLEQEFATLQAAQQLAELAAKEAATLEIELASKRAADAATAREAQRQQADDLAAERAKAEAEVHSELDQFAAVDGAGIELTIEPDEANAANIVPAEKVRKAPEDTLIMIADDSKVVRVKTSRVLLKHLYQVTLAEDGNEAASQLDFIMPDLLITDVEMPGMDGFELTHHLRSNPATAKLPIIMISGGSDELVDKAKLAGIDVLLGKPYSDEDLLSHIRRLTHGT